MSTLLQYRVFIAVVEHGSIARAADALNYSPPAISKQLAQLEHHLQVALFHRSHKRLDISDAGRRFYPKCKSILDSVRLAEDEIQAERHAICGPIAITVSKALARSPLFDALLGFSEQYPSIRLNLQFNDQLEDLHDKNLNFALRLGKLNDHSHLVATPLMNTQLVACASPEYLKRRGQPQSLSELSDGGLVLPSIQSASLELRQSLNSGGLNPKQANAHVCDDVEGVYQCVRAGLGVGLLLDVSIQRELHAGSLMRVLPTLRLPRKRLYLLSRHNRWQSQKERAFKQYLKARLSSE